MSAKGYKVGGEVDSFCTKCKMMLNHRIVSILDGEPAKVMCMTCDKPEVRVYRPHPPGQRAAKAGRSPREAGATKAGGGTSVRAAGRAAAAERAEQARADRERTWEKAIAGRGVSDFRPYRISETFREGDLVKHSRFGDGVVTRILDTNKIEVLFKDEAKTLAQATVL
jgi:hypothetical protein